MPGRRRSSSKEISDMVSKGSISIGEAPKRAASEPATDYSGKNFYNEDVVNRAKNRGGEPSRMELKAERIIKWTGSVILWIFGLLSMFIGGGVYVFLGILLIIQGLLACPKITEFTCQNEWYTEIKGYIVAATIIVWLIVFYMFVINADDSIISDNVTNVTDNITQ